MLYICDHADGNCLFCPCSEEHEIGPSCGNGQICVAIKQKVRCVPAEPSGNSGKMETMHACETCGQPTGRTCPCGCEGE